MELYTMEGFKKTDIQHWGIKGQKWGERRFQYKDGSLTPAGKKRYSKGKAVAETTKKVLNKISDKIFKDDIFGRDLTELKLKELERYRNEVMRELYPPKRKETTLSKILNYDLSKYTDPIAKALHISFESQNEQEKKRREELQKFLDDYDELISSIESVNTRDLDNLINSSRSNALDDLERMARIQRQQQETMEFMNRMSQESMNAAMSSMHYATYHSMGMF